MTANLGQPARGTGAAGGLLRSMRLSAVITGGFGAGLLGCGGDAPAARPVERLQFVEELRIGTLEEGPASFGDIRSLLIDRRGNIWAIDFQAQEVRVFGPDGGFLRTVGRKGEGPGEFVYADGLTQTPDGRVWVHDPRLGRLSAFDEDGRYLSQVGAPARGYGYRWQGGVDPTGRIWDSFVMLEGDSARIAYRRYAADLRSADTVSIATCSPPPGRADPGIRSRRGGAAIRYLPGAASAIDFGGRIACVPWTAEPEGVILALETGDTLGRFVPSTSMLPLQPAQRDSEVTRLTDFARQLDVSFDPDRVPRARPSLTGPFFDDGGRIWLIRLTLDSRFEFDRIGPDGRIDAVLDSQLEDFSFVRFLGDRAYFVTTRDGVPVILRARIEPAPAGRP